MSEEANTKIKLRTGRAPAVSDHATVTHGSFLDRDEACFTGAFFSCSASGLGARVK